MWSVASPTRFCLLSYNPFSHILSPVSSGGSWFAVLRSLAFRISVSLLSQPVQDGASEVAFQASKGCGICWV